MSAPKFELHPDAMEVIGHEVLAGHSIELIMHNFRDSVIAYALEVTAGNQSQAAKLLKTNRNNLIRWMAESKK